MKPGRQEGLISIWIWPPKPIRDLGRSPRRAPTVRDPTTPTNSSDPSLISAIKKLGLNLEPIEGPGKFIVIDHVERPSGK
jgi:uncharacterized protein (TIGR03435 family)